MISDSTALDFTTLLSYNTAIDLLSRLDRLISGDNKNWQQTTIKQAIANNANSLNTTLPSIEDSDQLATAWLIKLFDTLFAEQKVVLVRGTGEPEYFPATSSNPARIKFAHGFFASALHEISHWCVAGQQRRKLSDFGYWYAADGRSQAQQQAFERVEIKPQALECLFTLACQRSFRVSQDNLFADFDTSASTFALDVYNQATYYIDNPQSLPRDAKTLLWALLFLHIKYIQ